jgi:diaminohydroxyphosphoribosylaminopyrimidine deaminase/5-amino-6-(5-phosphoribosylamino)uracil reductase
MHEQFLLVALQQARLGRGLCAPNPSVGAVAVQNGKIISQAWHQSAGKPHAEQLVLAKLPPNLQDITLYVTLEPCNHWGKTPPCVDEIVKYGVRRVVYAYADPNPIVAENNTPSLLEKHGIEVLYFQLAVVDDFYKSYRHWILSKRPYLTAKIAQTFDGKIAGPLGSRRQLTNSKCSEFTHQKRQQADIILTTARTINLDDPQLNVRLQEGTYAKPIAIIDRKGTVNPEAKVFSNNIPCHIFYDEQYSITDPLAKAEYHPVSSLNGLLDLESIVIKLGSLGYHDVWVEAGGRLFSSLHEKKLVQQTYIYLAPSALGEDSITAYHYDIFSNPHSITWETKGNNVIASLIWNETEETVCSRA